MTEETITDVNLHFSYTTTSGCSSFGSETSPFSNISFSVLSLFTSLISYTSSTCLLSPSLNLLAPFSFFKTYVEHSQSVSSLAPEFMEIWRCFIFILISEWRGCKAGQTEKHFLLSGSNNVEPSILIWNPFSRRPFFNIHFRLKMYHFVNH